MRKGKCFVCGENLTDEVHRHIYLAKTRGVRGYIKSVDTCWPCGNLSNIQTLVKEKLIAKGKI